ncbi:MAG: TAT-variant-translocated molybdopterin oxidoreductase, partial [Candidatus Hydrogenedentes bacterium]|nr:TAT-variant-translocated molybdopterin oxidoreductase [Candidatus Hydrogenedentota bacterium]
MKNNDSTKVLEENTQPAPRLDLGDVRRRLAGSKGKAYWRSLDELAGTPEFQELLHREFPREASVMEDGVGRRNFLKIMSASLALAGLTSCARQPSEQILPYIQPPESVIPGKSQYFATAMTLGGYGIGLLAESHTGRPTKLEGNPSHSASLGSTTACEQASILTLYDPDRSNTILQRGEIATWEMFKEELTAALAPLKENGGRGVHILTGTVTSPALGHQLNQLRTKYPNITWHQFDAVNRDNVRKGARLAFGEDIETRYNFSKADCILALDADFFSEGPGRVRYTRDFSERRAPGNEGVAMNRLYAVESTPGLAGAMADHRLPLSPSRIAHFTHALAAALGVPGAAAPGELSEHEQHWLDVVAQDLRLHGANSLVLAGESQSADIQYLVHGINAALGGAGTTIEYTAP